MIATALLEVEGVGKSFGSLRAVDGVSFTVPPGQVLGIAGPNGSGKSTLFNLLTGLPFGPDSGRVRFSGVDITGSGAATIARLGIARTFQRETAFDALTVLENAQIGATYGGPQRHAADEALHFVGFVKADRGRPAASLSVFDRKRLMLATALAMRPRLLLLDEPASGLTRPEIEQTVTLLRRVAEGGMTILLIEHVLTFLMSLSHHLMVLNEGRVLAEGRPEDVVRDSRVIEAYLGRRRAA